MSDGSIRVVCSRCGSENNRTSRQALHVFAWIYCFTFRRQRYRCQSCNSRFYGRRRRRPNPLQHGSDDPLSVAPANRRRTPVGTKLAADSRSTRQCVELRQKTARTGPAPDPADHLKCYFQLSRAACVLPRPTERGSCPRWTTYFGPRTALAGFAARIPPVVR